MHRSVPTPRVLAIHAHPDDIEFQCAGTLALLKQRGCHITTATMTPGDCGSAELGPDEISAVRRAEAKAAADLLGADYLCLEFRDGRYRNRGYHQQPRAQWNHEEDKTGLCHKTPPQSWAHHFHLRPVF